MIDTPDFPTPRSPASPDGDILPAAGWNEDEPPHRGAFRSGPPGLWSRVFNIGMIGWIRLAASSLIVGLVVRAADLNPFSGDFSLPAALGSIVAAIAGMFAWALANGWAPFLLGALVVMPVFVLWRLVAMPFRSKRASERDPVSRRTPRIR